MILLCDEDVGTKAPRALTLVGYDVRSLFQMHWHAKQDTWWLAEAGDRGWLVFSRNHKMLLVPTERTVIQKHKVGVVYLTSGHEHPASMLRLLLKKWEWLEEIDRSLQRPFARFLSPDGRVSDSYRTRKL